MASFRPSPLHPRTPSPLRDSSSSTGSGVDEFSNSPIKLTFNGPASSNLDENFPAMQKTNVPTITTTTLPLAEQDTNSFYSPMSMESAGSRNSLLMVDDHNGAFNFQQGLMAKGPVAKAVSVGSPDELLLKSTDKAFSAEHRSTSRSQVQTFKRFPPILSRACSSPSSITPQLSPSPYSQRMSTLHVEQPEEPLLLVHHPRSCRSIYTLVGRRLSCSYRAIPPDPLRFPRCHALRCCRRLGQL